jgi:hypothetical protein
MSSTVIFYSSILLSLACMLMKSSQACDVVGATACPHKPETDLKDENLELYCSKYKDHLECVYKKYKGCDRKEKYVEAMESMVRGLRKRARQMEKVCEIDIAIPEEEEEAEEEQKKSGGGGGKGNKSKGKQQDIRSNGYTTLKQAATQSPCKISQIATSCQLILANIHFNAGWNGVLKQRWCNSATSYHSCLKSSLVNCHGNQYAESIRYYESMLNYIHSQANINCPGGLEGCMINLNDVRCKMGVKFGETNAAAERGPTSRLGKTPCLIFIISLTIIMNFSFSLF